MEKEFNFDQEVVTINVSDEEIPEQLVAEEIFDEDYTTVDESEIDWSRL